MKTKRPLTLAELGEGVHDDPHAYCRPDRETCFHRHPVPSDWNLRAIDKCLKKDLLLVAKALDIIDQARAAGGKKSDMKRAALVSVRTAIDDLPGMDSHADGCPVAAWSQRWVSRKKKWIFDLAPDGSLWTRRTVCELLASRIRHVRRFLKDPMQRHRYIRKAKRAA